MTTKKKPVITHKKLSTNKACPKPFKNTFGHLMNEIADMKPSKPATILYKKLPDNMILITGFENFLTVDDIFDKYGRIITKAYIDFPYRMSGAHGAVFLFGLEHFSTIGIGQLFNKHDFSKLIAHVKKCGGLLHDIIQAVNSGEVKRITI